MGAGTRDLTRHVYVPAALVWVVSALRVSIGQAFTAAIMCELLGATKGLGWIVAAGQAAVKPEWIMAGLFFAAVIVVLIDVVILSRFVAPPEYQEHVPGVRERALELPVTVWVRLRTGREAQVTMRHHRGMPRNPATEEDQMAKFTMRAPSHVAAHEVLATLNRPGAAICEPTATCCHRLVAAQVWEWSASTRAAAWLRCYARAARRLKAPNVNTAPIAAPTHSTAPPS